MKPDELICSRSFLDTILTEYPSLRNDRALRRLFAYLVFGTWRCVDTGNLMIPAEILAHLEEKEHLLEHRNYNSEAFLRRFSEQVAQIQYIDFVYLTSRCRTVHWVNWSPNTWRVIAQERSDRQGRLSGSSSNEADRVFFVDGRRVTQYAIRTQQKKLRQEALERIVDAGCTDAKHLLQYLNSQKTNRYTQMLSNLDAALSAALEIQDERARNHAIDTLLAIQEHPMPFYQASPRGRTVRIFPMTTSLLTLNSYVRKVLTPEWIDMDLRNAQAAIIASDWHIASLQDFLDKSLSGGQSLWTYLLTNLNIEKLRHALLKPALKDALYATVFGSTERNICYHLSHDSSTIGLGRKFLDIPIMRDILVARERRMSEIIDKGGATNIYGDWISLPPENTPEVGVRSVLAQCAQAAELKLMAPVVDLAIGQKGKKSGFDIMLFQHDGMSVVPHKKEDEKHWILRLQQAVDEQANRLGYKTRLEVSEFDPESTLLALNAKIKKQKSNQARSSKNRVMPLHLNEMPSSDTYLFR